MRATLKQLGRTLWAQCYIAYMGLSLALAIIIILGGVLFTLAYATGVLNVLLGSNSAGILSTTLTIGNDIVSGTGLLGYQASPSLGSLSPDNIGSYTVESIYEEYSSSAVVGVEVTVSPCVPNQNWLGNVTFHSNTFSGSTATYSCSSSVSTWAWTTSTGWAFSQTSGTEYSGTIAHQ